MSAAVSRHVHIRHIRHVILHERREPRRPGSRLQFPHFRAVDDTSVHGKLA